MKPLAMDPDSARSHFQRVSAKNPPGRTDLQILGWTRLARDTQKRKMAPLWALSENWEAYGERDLDLRRWSGLCAGEDPHIEVPQPVAHLLLHNSALRTYSKALGHNYDLQSTMRTLSGAVKISV